MDYLCDVTQVVTYWDKFPRPTFFRPRRCPKFTSFVSVVCVECAEQTSEGIRLTRIIIDDCVYSYFTTNYTRSCSSLMWIAIILYSESVSGMSQLCGATVMVWYDQSACAQYVRSILNESSVSFGYEHMRNHRRRRRRFVPMSHQRHTTNM